MKINKKKAVKVAVIFLATAVTICWADGCTRALGRCQVKTAEADSVEQVLKNLKQKTEQLESYRGQIEYLFSQPLFESQTLRKGVLYYQSSGGKSKLRINFQTLKQDDGKEQGYIEQYIFDGLWLTHIDYQIRQVKCYQKAEPNNPVNCFDMVSSNFPIIGFNKTSELEKEFVIRLVEDKQAEAEDFIQLHLDVKPTSIYKDDYTSIDFWIDKKLYLPARIVAISTEEDIYRIEFLQPQVNQPIDKQIFEVKIPKGFTVEKIPLKKKN